MQSIQRMFTFAALALLAVGCGGGDDSSSGSADTDQAAPAQQTAREVIDRTAPATVTVSTDDTTVSVGEEVELTAVISHVPEGMNRWMMSMGWEVDGGRSRANSLQDTEAGLGATRTFTFDTPGEHTVVAKFYHNNAVFAEQTFTITVE